MKLKITDAEFELIKEIACLEIAKRAPRKNSGILPQNLPGLIAGKKTDLLNRWPRHLVEDYIALAIQHFDADDDTSVAAFAGSGVTFPGEPHNERIGVALVHGVGEQKRFEHLDGEIRKLVESLRAMPIYDPANGGKVVVEITPGEAGGFEADQDIWQIGPTATVRVIAATKFLGTTEFSFHEVWWADVNETYSIAKQFRFWFWGLSVWNYPPKQRSGDPGAEYVYPPKVANKGVSFRCVKFRLFLVGVVFSMLGFSIAIGVYVLNRLFDMETPDFLKTITNYVSGVKLYNQPEREAFFGENDDFLDNMDVPPRYSIRRRMMRALADVAWCEYDRWFVLAHSLGSLVAFNGLMETAYTWPGYLDEARWNQLRTKYMAGPPAAGTAPIPTETTPGRPTWCNNEIAYRTTIFKRFRGMLTYGSPLEKFATIWPARVPIAREWAFQSGSVWVNAMDPIDPVSGLLVSFDDLPDRCCPHPRNIPYRADWVLLYAHLKYLSPKKKEPSPFDLATSTNAWMLGMRDEPGAANNDLKGYTYPPHGAEFRRRTGIAWAWWMGSFLIMALIAALIMPLFFKTVAVVWTGLSKEICENTGFCSTDAAQHAAAGKKTP